MQPKLKVIQNRLKNNFVAKQIKFFNKMDILIQNSTHW